MSAGLDRLEDLEARGDRYRPLVQQEMRAVVGDAPEPLYAWMRYHLGWESREGHPVAASPGKMLRPLALLLAALVAAMTEDEKLQMVRTLFPPRTQTPRWFE